MCLVFDFSISNLAYMEIFMKIWQRNFLNYLTIWLFAWQRWEKADAKNENEYEKFGRMNLIFELPISKLGYMEDFMKTWE